MYMHLTYSYVYLLHKAMSFVLQRALYATRVKDTPTRHVT